MISRRALLTVILGAPAALAACQSGGPSLSQLAQDADTLAQGVQAALDAVKGAKNLSANVVSVFSAAVADVKKVASELVGGITNANVGSLATDIAGMVAATAGVKVPTVVSTILDAASSLLPVILSAAGIALAGGPAPVMSAAEARLLLRSAATGALR